MAIMVTVFCRSQQLLSTQTLIEEICNGVFFDEDPRFDPAPHSAEAKLTHWSGFHVYYHPDKRPVVVYHDIQNNHVQLLIKERQERIVHAGLAHEQSELISHLTASYQTFTFEIDPWATDDAWVMASALEAFLAHTLDGVIAADEGFYNKNLQILCAI